MGVKYFDYVSIARECGISEETLKRLEDLERKEFPRDQMMFELHMLRLIKSIKKKIVKLEEILNKEK